ncbi:hypothetical protein GCM10025865_01690 [Paraoerskovia sediminicola]|uniref:DUF4349 domain-containing protein n=1 Tax=Paraoerskovia sediminicola TaxID=1138587 RepID=A0ABM8FYN8_9CELL|nr:DUF4349 domain-containing protein [Paraoerskovia sediminicola]BDZ40870.1 hypothetical protein GCM10025865_01690 [Paraoerskovia sediminicola]
MDHRSRLLRSATALALVALFATGCSASGEDSSAADDAAVGSDAIDSSAGRAAGPELVEGPVTDAADGASTDTEADPDADRSEITTGSVWLRADDPSVASQQIAGMVEAAGGRVESRSQFTPDGDDGGDPSASMSVRIPSESVTATIEALDEVGEVTEVSVDTVDVTAQAQDLDARIAALTASTRRLTELMADATSTEDLLTAEKELTARQAELDSLTNQRDQLSDQVAMSTLWITIDVPSAPTELAPGGFTGGLATGWDALLTFVNATVVTVGVLVPWLALGAVVLVVVLAVRRRHRRRSELGGAGPDDDGRGDPDADPGTGPGSGGPAQSRPEHADAPAPRQAGDRVDAR